MNIKDLNIKLIDLRMYNDQQLSVVTEKLNLVDGCLQKLKKDGFAKLWLDDVNGIDVGYMLKSDMGVNNAFTYKGLVINDGIILSKKEKDSLLKMKPTVFDTKKPKNRSDVKVTDKVVESKESKDETFDVDSLIKEKQLLDSKISKLLKQMESELILCLENEDYEKAAILRDKINKLK
jgi:hypothetical protein